MTTSNDTITVTSAIQAALLEEELKGQISDGMWENTNPRNHWQRPCNATVVVGSAPGHNFRLVKNNYNFASKALIDCVGDRMLAIGRRFDPTYDLKALRSDLNAIKEAFRTLALVEV